MGGRIILYLAVLVTRSGVRLRFIDMLINDVNDAKSQRLERTVEDGGNDINRGGERNSGQVKRVTVEFLSVNRWHEEPTHLLFFLRA